MSFFESRDAYPHFWELVSDEIDCIKNDLNEEIELDAIILYEAFYSAKQTAARHKNFISSYNKEAAHLCFWIRKLKPAHVVDRPTIISRLKSQLPSILARDTDEELQKVEALQAQLDAQKNYIDVFRYPLNEKLALMVAFGIICLGDAIFAEDLRSEGKAGQADEILEKGANAAARIERLSPIITHSMRRDNYSAKSMATYFEWIFSD